MKLTPEDIAEARMLVDAGATYQAVAARYGVCHATIQYHVKLGKAQKPNASAYARALDAAFGSRERGDYIGAAMALETAANALFPRTNQNLCQT